MERIDQKNSEQEYLKKAFRDNPELFPKNTYTEDAKFLRNFGINIPGKDHFPKGYLKLFASDFIVEEISIDKTVSTIDYNVDTLTIPVKDNTNDNHRALFATLVKCHISTVEAIDEIAKTIGCTRENIHYAGLKDKHALTAQEISFHNIDASKLNLVNSPYYFLKNLRFGKGGVEKGGLFGNRFTLFIRTPQIIDQQKFTEQAKKISSEGFYNFYYLQRFGAPRFCNYQWGFDILRGKYKETIIDFLTHTNTRELPYFQNMRNKIGTLIPNWEEIFKLVEPFSVTLFNEHRILKHLLNSKEDYLGALQAIPEQTMLWTYGFASLLFNESISSRINTGQVIPNQIPLLLSRSQSDIDFYAPLLKSIKYYPVNFKNLLPFPHIQVRTRQVQTKEHIDIEKISFTPAGIALRFTLKKGEYATTFLSHLLDLISGHPPTEISTELTDTNMILENESQMRSLTYFKGVNNSKSDLSLDAVEVTT